jgi:hypothetical protein
MNRDANLEQEYQDDLDRLFGFPRPPNLLQILRQIRPEEKRFCILSNGMMALANGEPKVGDRAFVARGASFP